MKNSLKAMMLLCGGLLAMGGCAAQQTPAPEVAKASAAGDASTYAAALEEAFTSYEAEIAQAASIEYQSQAELDAVIATLSEAHFDWSLRQALAQRGLSVDNLGAFALENPNFFHAEQQRHWGRLEHAQDQLRQAQIMPGTHAILWEAEEPIQTASVE